MQYLLNDLMKLPLSERLTVIELAINSFSLEEEELNSENFSIAKKIMVWKYQSVDNMTESYELKSK